MITHWTPKDYAALDREPHESADMISRFAPATFNAVITAYCAMVDEDPPAPGRHIEDTPPL